MFFELFPFMSIVQAALTNSTVVKDLSPRAYASISAPSKEMYS